MATYATLRRRVHDALAVPGLPMPAAARLAAIRQRAYAARPTQLTHYWRAAADVVASVPEDAPYRAALIAAWDGRPAVAEASQP